ncbi:MAG: metallophosphoesterase [Micropruina sp.]
MIGRWLGRVALLGAACVGYGLIEARTFRVRRVEVPILPPGSLDLRVLHLSDIHLMVRQGRKTEFVRALAGLEPDLVINTGDNFSQPEAMEPLLDAFGRLLDVPGGFVFGSNDYTAPRGTNPLGYLVRPTSDHAGESIANDLPWGELRDAFTARGWHDLNHQRASLELLGTRLEMRGTDDGHLGRDDYSQVAGPAAPGTDVSLGVTHAPYLRLLDAMTSDGLDLILAGHTHGGQVCVPFYGALVTNCDLDTERVKGLSQHTVGSNTSWLHVSGGIGTSPFAPYRFACPPEATLLTLKARPS